MTEPAPRRMGPVDAPVRLAMLDAAEAILREEGYAALSSRRVAELADVKQRLVYYYFRSMDELAVETFRRLAARQREELRRALASPDPLNGVWQLAFAANDPRLVAEFTALAHRHAALREEVARFIEEERRLQVEALRRAGKADGALAPEALAVLAASVAVTLAREQTIGASMGHAEVMAAIRHFLADR